jgi:hypothetical protein
MKKLTIILFVFATCFCHAQEKTYMVTQQQLNDLYNGAGQMAGIYTRMIDGWTATIIRQEYHTPKIDTAAILKVAKKQDKQAKKELPVTPPTPVPADTTKH